VNAFFWTDGHLGWSFFSLLVFAGLWLLLADLVWRLKAISIGRLAVALVIGWLIGVGLIFVGFHFSHW
jgi:hypothetical protein